ncbi:MAG TPA: hypothetical protein VFZ49_04600 [Pyrinomonadaceae bacterium]
MVRHYDVGEHQNAVPVAGFAIRLADDLLKRVGAENGQPFIG